VGEGEDGRPEVGNGRRLRRDVTTTPPPTVNYTPLHCRFTNASEGTTYTRTEVEKERGPYCECVCVCIYVHVQPGWRRWRGQEAGDRRQEAGVWNDTLPRRPAQNVRVVCTPPTALRTPCKQKSETKTEKQAILGNVTDDTESKKSIR
jgi:hypothetical protein